MLSLTAHLPRGAAGPAPGLVDDPLDVGLKLGADDRRGIGLTGQEEAEETSSERDRRWQLQKNSTHLADLLRRTRSER